MLNLLGANPGVGIVIGIALLVFGLLTGRAVLAIAGGFVLVASAVRLLGGAGRDKPTDGKPQGARR